MRSIDIVFSHLEFLTSPKKLDWDVVEVYPFTWLKNSLLETNFKTVLIGWQEISEEEYEMYNKDETEANPNPIAVPLTSPLGLIKHNPSNDLEC